MKHFAFALVLLLITPLALADTGGPYEFVPDLADDEVSPVLPIPDESRPLTYYLNHLPTPKWEAGHPEPSFLEWAEMDNHHASVSTLDYVSGHLIYAIRYVKIEKLERGINQADRILIVARNQDNSEVRPVYFVNAPEDRYYDHEAEYLQDEPRGGVGVSLYVSGNGGHVVRVYIRGAEEGFERFTPGEEAD